MGDTSAYWTGPRKNLPKNPDQQSEAEEQREDCDGDHVPSKWPATQMLRGGRVRALTSPGLGDAFQEWFSGFAGKEKKQLVGGNLEKQGSRQRRIAE